MRRRGSLGRWFLVAAVGVATVSATDGRGRCRGVPPARCRAPGPGDRNGHGRRDGRSPLQHRTGVRHLRELEHHHGGWRRQWTGLCEAVVRRRRQRRRDVRGGHARSIVVAAIIPSENRPRSCSRTRRRAPGVPVDRATGGQGSWEDAVHDHLLPLLEFYETWGRDLEVRFFRSSGSDEAAQRSDAVAIKALKPFAAVDLLSSGLLTLEAELASAKIVTFGTATTSRAGARAGPVPMGSVGWRCDRRERCGGARPAARGKKGRVRRRRVAGPNACVRRGGGRHRRPRPVRNAT